METMKAVWNRIDTWLDRHAPAILSKLQPGATDEELRQAEAVIGIELPQEVRASYRVHNGYTGDAFIEEWRLISLKEMSATWQIMKNILDAQDPTNEYFFGPQDERSLSDPFPLQAVWWHPKWIPLLAFGNGDGLYVDGAPGPTGHHGQLISFWHEDAAMNDVVAPGWLAYLSAFAEDLEAGKYFLNSQGLLETEDDFVQQSRWKWVDRYA